MPTGSNLKIRNSVYYARLKATVALAVANVEPHRGRAHDTRDVRYCRRDGRNAHGRLSRHRNVGVGRLGTEEPSGRRIGERHGAGVVGSLSASQTKPGRK